MILMDKKHLFNVLRMLFAFLLLTFILIRIGPMNLFNTLLSANPFLVLLAIFFALFLILMNALAIDVLLKHIIIIPFLDFFKKYLLSWAFGTMLPGRLGDFSLGFLLRKKIPASKVFAIVLIDKLVTLFLYSSITLIGIFYLFTNNVILHTVSSIVIFWFILSALLFSKQLKQIVLGFVKKYFKDHTLAISYFSKTFFFLLNKKRKAILTNFLMSSIRLLIITTNFYLLFLSFGVQPNYSALIVIVTMVAILAVIPISLNGLGVREVSFIFLCTLIGIPELISASVVLISTSMSYVFVSLVFVYQLVSKKQESVFK